MKNKQQIGDIINSTLSNANNNSMNKIGKSVHKKTSTTIISIIALVFSTLSMIHSISYEKLQFDYIGVVISIISIAVTFLIGWNFYQLIDFKEKTKELDEANKRVNEALNNIHNKADYNQAIAYGIMSQNASVHFAHNEKEVVKLQMLSKGLTALKILSKFPDCDKEIASLSNTLIKGMGNSSMVLLDEKNKINLLLLCGEIVHKEKIPKYYEIVELIKKS